MMIDGYEAIFLALGIFACGYAVGFTTCLFLTMRNDESSLRRAGFDLVGSRPPGSGYQPVGGPKIPPENWKPLEVSLSKDQIRKPVLRPISMPPRAD